MILSLLNTDPIFIISIIFGFLIFLVGFWVAINNKKKDIYNYFFFLLIFSTIAWIIFVLLRFYSYDKDIIIFSTRMTFGCAVLVSFFIFYFTLFFPKFEEIYNKLFHIIFILLSGIVFLLSIGPVTVSDINIINNIQTDVYDNGYFIFIFYFLFAILLSLYNSLSKMSTLNRIEKYQNYFMLTGLILSILTAFTTNVLITLFTGITSIAKLGPLSLVFFIILTSIAIFKYKLFNIKIIATELLIFALWIIILIRTLISESTTDYVVNGILLISTISIGIFLIRSVIKEVSQREKIEKLAQELSQANEQLRDNNEKLKELDRMKTEFVSMASHQLRTPLTAIKGYSSMLLEDFFGEIKGKVREAVDIVYQSSERLVVIIDDFLSITKIELGKMDFQVSSFDLKDLVKVIVKESKVTADKKNLALELEILPGDYTFSGDHGKISQVISNILDNAMKYTEKGGIFAKLEEKDKDKIRITVKDTGIGMTKEDISQLFEKFVRVGQDGRPKYTGTGIGLFLVRQLVEAHQGRVWAESEGPDKGSTFVVEIPKEGKGE